MLMIIFIFRINFFNCSLLHGLGEGHDKDDKIRLTEGLVLPAPQLTIVRSPQVLPGNDQNISPTNQKTAGSKLERTSLLMFYGSRRHLKSFSGNFLVLIFLLGCLLTYLMKSLVCNGTTFE